MSNGSLTTPTFQASSAVSWDNTATTALNPPQILDPSLLAANNSELFQDPRADRDNSDLASNGVLNDTEENDPLGEGLILSQNAGVLGAPCSCLKELRSMLENFQSLPPPTFPSSRGPLIKATTLARVVVRCPFCPVDYPSALQNLMLLTTLLPLVVHSYANLLQHIEDQAARGCRITYRVGDLSPAASHLHTGTIDCPMGFNVELDSAEWAAIARKVLKQDIFGQAENSDCLNGVVDELEQRQHFWHLLQPFSEHGSNGSCHYQQPHDSGNNGLCLQLIAQIRKAMEVLKL